jgi:hypothetical protein
MLLVTEYDECLDIEKKVPPSVIRKIYLTEGVNHKLNNQPTLFGPPLFLVNLGYSLRSAENFIKTIPSDANVILISPLSRWNLYQSKLGLYDGIKKSAQFDTRESKVELVMKLTGLSKKKASIAMELLAYNFSLLEKNLDLLRWCSTTGADLESALSSVEYYSYTDVLFYLCGSQKHTREKFLRTLAKYRYANKHMLKYLRKTIEAFIDHKLDGEKPTTEHSYTVKRLSSFLYLEDAITLQVIFKNSNSLIDLLRGELQNE